MPFGRKILSKSLKQQVLENTVGRARTLGTGPMQVLVLLFLQVTKRSSSILSRFFGLFGITPNKVYELRCSNLHPKDFVIGLWHNVVGNPLSVVRSRRIEVWRITKLAVDTGKKSEKKCSVEM